MYISGWGNYPKIESQIFAMHSYSQLRDTLHNLSGNPRTPAIIARGLGRSYGDSALQTHIFNMQTWDYLLAFDTLTGELRCSAGASLADILSVFVPQGWFLPVTPGTKFVTVGGAIASDVHGKNHHLSGCFSEYVQSVKLMLADGRIVLCSKRENQQLFHATCGGMGLTGIILEATIKLQRISSSFINATTITAESIIEAIELLEEHQTSTYSVAWIDCLATGEKMGRSIIMLGEHAKEGAFLVKRKSRLNVPIHLPSSLLNHYFIEIFNEFYYRQNSAKHKATQQVHYETFFYPLDNIRNWNRLYSKKGFLQYQFVLPISAGAEGMRELLKKITQSKLGSFLAVLKLFGKANKNYLSFPIEGYTLALDFKMSSQLFGLLNELDKLVLSYGGRIYLTKDSRMNENTFKKTYAEWEVFSNIRSQYDKDKLFQSLQSQRLGL